jgi:hypothetical protein
MQKVGNVLISLHFLKRDLAYEQNAKISIKSPRKSNETRGFFVCISPIRMGKSKVL